MVFSNNFQTFFLTIPLTIILHLLTIFWTWSFSPLLKEKIFFRTILKRNLFYRRINAEKVWTVIDDEQCWWWGRKRNFFRWLTYILKSKCDLQTFARFVFKFNNTEKKSIYYRWAYLVLLTGTSNLLKTLKRLKSFIVLKT